MVDHFHTCLVQYAPGWGLYQENLDKLDVLLNKSPVQLEQDCIVVLPEMFPTGFYFGMNQITIRKSAAKSLEWMQHWAKTANALIIGSMAVEDDGKYYNRCYCVKSDSLEYYDKHHLFGMSEEPEHFTAGQRQLIIEWRGWRIKPIICYDLRFPAWCLNNSSEPYDVLLCVASWPAVRRDVWLALLKARAIENQCYVIGVNRIGNDGHGIYHQGDSIIYGAKGEIIWQMGDAEQVASFSLSHHELMSFRKKFPVLSDMDKIQIFT